MAGCPTRVRTSNAPAEEPFLHGTLPGVLPVERAVYRRMRKRFLHWLQYELNCASAVILAPAATSPVALVLPQCGSDSPLLLAGWYQRFNNTSRLLYCNLQSKL